MQLNQLLFFFPWSKGGSSGSECSETYHGTSAESEPETQNTANYFRLIYLMVCMIAFIKKYSSRSMYSSFAMNII